MKLLVIACVISTSILCACSGGGSSNTGSATSTAIIPNTTRTSVAAPTIEIDPFKITASSYELTDMNEQWWTFSYKVTILNNTDHSLKVNLIIQYLDSDNYDIGTEHLSDVSILPGDPTTLTGSTKISAEYAWDLTGISVGFN